jgi:hypothetical protein
MGQNIHGFTLGVRTGRRIFVVLFRGAAAENVESSRKTTRGDQFLFVATRKFWSNTRAGRISTGLLQHKYIKIELSSPVNRFVAGRLFDMILQSMCRSQHQRRIVLHGFVSIFSPRLS